MSAQLNNHFNERLDSMLADQEMPGKPGCACAVTNRGQLIYENAFGLADIEKHIPLTSSAIMGMGSVSKHFTAYALLELQKKGMLSMNDPVTKYIPLPFLEDTIRISQLLTHTAGFHESNDFFDILYDDPGRRRTMNRIREFLDNHRRLEFEPGTQYSYNNTGYSLAAFIVEKVSGKPFPEFLSDEIFMPLGMNNTAVLTDHSIPLKGLAVPYKMRGNSTYIVDSLKHDFYGFTGVFTTIRDLTKWDANLSRLEKTGDPLFKELTSPRYLENGKPIHYGYGLELGAYHGLKTISHTGRDNGYTAFYVRFPEKAFSIISICNYRYEAPWDLCYRMADILFTPGSPYSGSMHVQHPVVLNAAALAKEVNLAGLFWSPQKSSNPDAVIRIEKKEEQIILVYSGRRQLMKSLDGMTLSPVNSPERWLVVLNGEKQVKNMVVTLNRDTTAIYFPVSPFKEGEDTETMEGTYRSAEMGITVTIHKENSEWVIDHPEIGKVILSPLFKNGFRSQVGIIVWEHGQTDRFRLLYKHITHLYFERVK